MSFQVNLPVGKRHKFRDQEFWAEGGMICIENQLNGNYKVIPRAEAAARAIALNAELPLMQYADEKQELCNCVVDLCEAVKEAKTQGDPILQKVRQQRLKDSRKHSIILSDGGVILTPKQSSQNLSERFKKLEI